MTTSSLYSASQLLVGELIKRASHKDPDHDGYVFGNERMTHLQMDRKATQFAGWLQEQGIQINDKVGFILKNSIVFPEVLFGVALSGGVGVPINFRLTADEVQYIVNNSDSRLLIIDEEFTEMVHSIREHIPNVEKVIVVSQNPAHNFIPYESIFERVSPYQPSHLVDNDAAMIVYTSGTTGRPKGAVLTHKNICLLGLNLMYESKAERYQCQLAAVPLFHIAGISILVRNCLVSGTLIIHREYNPMAVLETVQKEKITTLALVPAMWNFLFQVPTIDNYDLSSVTSCTTGAAICPLELKKRILKYFSNASLVDTFGQTETTSSATLLHGEDTLRKTTSVGKPTINVEVRIVDEEMNDVPVGEVGEIVYRGPTVMKEYYKNPEATAEAFKGGWFHSGDLVRMDNEGFIYVVDRKKDMIISGGENIYPAEIEEVLYAHPDILECAIIGVPDEEWGESVKAFIVLKPGTNISAEDIIAHCTQQLASYKKPKEIEFIEVLPRNASGKILKQVLRKNETISS